MKTFLTFTFLLTASFAFSQDNVSNHSRSLRVYSGLPYQQIGSTDEWYNPEYEFGFDVSHSIRFAKQFYFSIGAGANFSKYRTDPFVKEWFTQGYSPITGLYEIQWHTDDFERQTMGQLVRVSIPLQVEYMPVGQWRPYARLGLVFDAEISKESRDVHAHTNDPAPVFTPYGQRNVTSENVLLSASASIGLKYSKGSMAFLLGVTSQLGFFNFDKEFGASRYAIAGEFSIRKTISQTAFPHQGGSDGAKFKDKPSYVYLEAGGSAVLGGSVNYERNLVKNGGIRLNSKIGLGYSYRSSGQIVAPVGVSWISGPKHSIETGVDFVPVIGEFSDSYVTPRLGYRGEFGKRFLMRVTALGVWGIKYAEFHVWPGISIGAKL